MNNGLLLTCFLVYSALLFVITFLTSKKSSNLDFYVANRSSKWYVVSYGMIGASLSGITFMSIPGWVGTTQWTYLVVVLGYITGYFAIAFILLPLYYKLNLTTIYSYLGTRFGRQTHQTGAFFFILSRTIGASFRLFLVVLVLQNFILAQLGIRFEVTLALFLLLILAYTFKGGIKTVIWTDALQTSFMLLSVCLTLYLISKELHLNTVSLFNKMQERGLNTIWITNWTDKRHFLKQFLSGVFICIAMTGLDQEMMQKNLTCKNLKEAQKNMIVFSFIAGLVNLAFLILGGMLYVFIQLKGIAMPAASDQLFPTIAIHHLGEISALVFVIGLISAAYPSADGAMTSLTTSFCVDFLKLDQLANETKQTRKRQLVHVSFAFVLFVTIVIFKRLENTAVVELLFKAAGYTYGPLLGLFAFGLLTNLKIADKWSPLICIIAPLLTFCLNFYSPIWFNGFDFGFLILPLNGFITFVGLLLIACKTELCVE